MLKICICTIIVILIVVLIIILKIKKENEEDIDEEYDESKNAAEHLLKFFDEHPEIVEAIKKENRKKAQKEAEEDAKYNYPIKRSLAIEIANKSSTLKKDFCRNSERERNILSCIP